MQCNIDKKLIRRDMISKRKQMHISKVRENSDIILESFIDLNLDYKTVMCYLDFSNEVITKEFVSYFKINGYILTVPVCDDNNMFAAKFNDLDEFKVSKLGVLEPENPELIDSNLIDLCIIPGVAFDKQGNRVGYGKGYYDKFLRNKKTIKVAICHDFQLIDDIIQSDDNDVKMDYIITEKRVLKL